MELLSIRKALGTDHLSDQEYMNIVAEGRQRRRKRRPKGSLVYSTNPRVHAKMCELQNKRNNLDKPIHSSVRVGFSPEAMTVCETVNQASRTCTVVGQYKSATHRNYGKKSMHLSTLRKMRHKLNSV